MTAISSIHTTGGVLLQHSELVGDTVTSINFGIGMAVDYKVTGSGTLESWLTRVWKRPSNMYGEGVNDKGKGAYKGCTAESMNAP